MKTVFSFAAIALCAASAVYAQDSRADDSYNVDELYQIREFETATLDTGSKSSQGREVRFHVHIRYTDPAKRPQGAPALRVIRYLMRCDEKSLGVSAVLTLNERNELMKNYLFPPGGMDFFPVVEGSREDGWAKEVCS